jgi:hypothetical protein
MARTGASSKQILHITLDKRHRGPVALKERDAALREELPRAVGIIGDQPVDADGDQFRHRARVVDRSRQRQTQRAAADRRPPIRASKRNLDPVPILVWFNESVLPSAKL